MATEPSIPDYKQILINSLEEFKEEFNWCLHHPKEVTPEKIKDFQAGIHNIKTFFSEKIKDEKFIRDMERFEVLIYNLPKSLTDLEKETAEVVFDRIAKLINDLG